MAQVTLPWGGTFDDASQPADGSRGIYGKMPDGQDFYQPPTTPNPQPPTGTSGNGPGSANYASLVSMMNGMSGPGASVGGPAASVPGVQMPDTSAANAAAYARAKDQTGMNTRASLTALQNEMGANQMLGSGHEMGQTTDIIKHGATALNEVSREQAVKDAGMINQRAMADYQGKITQRGQDLSAAQANAARQAQALEGLMSMMTSGSGILY